MALIKSIPDPDGPGTIDAYAKLDRFEVLCRERVLSVAVAVYRSQAARDAVDKDGRAVYQPVRTDTYVVGPNPATPGAPTYDQFLTADATNPNGIGAQVYGFLKAFTPWTGSADA